MTDEIKNNTDKSNIQDDTDYKVAIENIESIVKNTENFMKTLKTRIDLSGGKWVMPPDAVQGLMQAAMMELIVKELKKALV